MSEERDRVDKRVEEIRRRSDEAMRRAEQAALDSREALRWISRRLEELRQQRAGAAPRKANTSK